MLSISSVMQDVSPLLAFKGKKIPFLQQKIRNCNMKLKMTRFDLLIFKERERVGNERYNLHADCKMHVKIQINTY